MTNGKQSDERAIFLAALEQAAPQAREAYLQRGLRGPSRFAAPPPRVAVSP